MPRSVHGEWSAPSGRRDPVELLEEQAASRVPELVPIRYGRMLVSPFTFYRGAAYLMAADLAGSQRTGLRVQLCGDAHLSNFGAFAAPDRRLVFDINDFDETLPGPFEWDLKRLVASFAVAGRDLGFPVRQRRGVNLAVTRAYREAMRGLASMKTLDLWYSRVDAEALIAQFQSAASAKRRKLMEKNLAKTRAKDSLRAFSKLTTIVDGEPRIVSDPPLIVPIEDLAGGRDIEEFARSVNRGYRRTLQGDRKHLLERFRYVHAARKVVGVGSVGTRAWIMLMLGRDNDDPLFLQLKEAQPSVLEPFLGKSEYANHGQRVVEGQRLMQAASDIMLGWHRVTGTRRRQARLLLPPALGPEGLGDHRGHETQRAGRLRRDLRPDAGPRARTLRRRRHDQRLPRLKRRARPGAGRLRRALRRPERARLRRAERRRQDRARHSGDRAIARTTDGVGCWPPIGRRRHLSALPLEEQAKHRPTVSRARAFSTEQARERRRSCGSEPLSVRATSSRPMS